jgi:hypothetical protein
MMDPAEELALVPKAIQETASGCCEWDDKAVERIRADRELRGLTPRGIKQDLQSYVRNNPEAVVQVREKREEYRHFEFYYKVILPLASHEGDLFLELVLKDPPDPDMPVVIIVNAHGQKN